MKLAYISYAKLKGEKHWNLILETAEDVQKYYTASGEIAAAQFFDVWGDMKKGWDAAHATNGRLHQGSVILAATKIGWKAQEEKEVSLADACDIHDQILDQRFQRMLKWIINGPIRVNAKGGCSPFDDFYQIHEMFECNENEMREYFIAGENMKFSLSFTKPIVVIENGGMLEDELLKKLGELNVKQNDYERALNFKYRTDNWSDKEFFTLFDNGIKNGLHTIIAQTKLYHTKQFGQLTTVLKKVMVNNPEKSLEVKLLIDGDVNDLKQYTNDLPSNLKLTLL